VRISSMDAAIIARIAQETAIPENSVEAAVSLFEKGATGPFIVHYRKEATGGLDENKVRLIQERLAYYREANDQRNALLKLMSEQGKLTDELRDKILAAVKLQEVEDLYLPYKPKRKTRGTIAKAKGLEPLALFILNTPRFKGDFNEILAQYINPELGVTSIEEALQGAKDIIAEMISESAEVRQSAREFLFENALIVSSKADTKKEDLLVNTKDVYEVYHNFYL